MDPKWLRNGFIYLLAGVALLAVFYTLFLPAQPGRDVDVTEMLTKARNNEVQRIEVSGDDLMVHLTNGDKVRTPLIAERGLFGRSKPGVMGAGALWNAPNLAEDLAATLEARALWARYGL